MTLVSHCFIFPFSQQLTTPAIASFVRPCYCPKKLQVKPMRWKSSSLMTGMQSLFNSLSSQNSALTESTLEGIRQVMLDSFASTTSNTEHPGLQLKLTYANDIQDLWYLRGDLMAAISQIEGETVARAKLSEITELFKGLLPRAMASRPSPLGNY